MKRILFLLSVIGLQLSAITAVAQTGSGKIDPEIRAEQIKEMKFGMFVCWSFSTFSGYEWTWGVKDVSFFNPTGFDPDQWCKTAKDAGMHYILFLTKHHDGFCLWDTKTTDRKVTRSPLGVDVLAEVKKSCEKYGLKLALYFSEGEFAWDKGKSVKWEDAGGSGFYRNGENPELKKAQLTELLTQYGSIEYIWFDHAIGDGGLSHAETAELVKSLQANCFVGFNHGDQSGANVRIGERGKPGPLSDTKAAGPYMKDDPGEEYLLAEFTYPILEGAKRKKQRGAQWFYSLPENDEVCVAAERIYEDYLGAVKYGNIFSLDVAPGRDGRLREIDVKTLQQVGKYIKEDAPLPPRPNIVIILADDLGYGDPQVYNPDSKIPTPNIDKLASEGMRFTDAHTPSSVCTPTRYGLLTGRYAWRTKLQKSVLWAWDKPLIAPDRLTLPKMLKTKSYNTACIGKWHLGWRWPSNRDEGYMNDTIPIGNYGLKGRNELWKYIDFSKPLGGGPLQAGFDYYFGDDVPNFAPYTFFENDRILKIPEGLKPDTMYGGPGPMSEGWSLEKVMPEIASRAVKYIEEHAQSEQPFFLYVPLTAPHTPIAPTDEFKGKSEAGLYGDFVHEVDGMVGKIVNALKKSGEFENTLLIFTSDNGSPQRDGTNMGGPIASVKKYGHDPSKPWRGMKADIWEGGHRVPFIASWPGYIEANTVSGQLICLTDLMASVASILNIPLNRNSAGDSYDISSVLLGETDKPIRTDVIHHSIDGTFAIRKGEWKLILGKNSGGFSKNIPEENIPVDTAGQLYNLTEDPGERSNLYAAYPEVVKELTAILLGHKTKGYSIPE